MSTPAEQKHRAEEGQVAQERDIRAGFVKERALSSGSLFKSKKNSEKERKLSLKKKKGIKEKELAFNQWKEEKSGVIEIGLQPGHFEVRPL